MSSIFRGSIDTFCKEPAHQVRLMLHEPAASVGSFIRDTFEHIDSRLESGFFVFQILELFLGIQKFGAFAIQAFFARGTLLGQAFQIGIGLFQPRIDFGKRRLGRFLLAAHGIHFVLPLFQVHL